MLMQEIPTKVSVLSPRPVLAAHVKALKTLRKKKSGELGLFSYSMRTFPSHLCYFLQTAKNTIFFPDKEQSKNTKAAFTENKY